ncbi:MAG: M48 family metallopeptidase [Bacteroidales bacterium]|nr:M48 family metallopeptidase [Bacteroidales bacterium]
MYNTVFLIIIVILVFSYILSEYLDFLNSKYRNKNIPDELKGIYDDEKYEKSQKYGKTNSKLSFLSSSFVLVLTLGMFFFGGFNFVNEIAVSFSDNKIIQALIFFGILLLASDIITTPFAVYSVFVIEEKFGFNKTTVKTFIFDKLKGWLLGAVIGGGILALITWFYLKTNNMFWIYAWITVSIFSVFMTMFYSSIIVPLFNKQTPLEDGELRNAIEKFARKAGFKLDNIFVIDGSKRSTKANAYFSGLGPKKRIVLYDTLINDLTVDEIVAVLAHETGHYKKKHTVSNIITAIVQSGIMFYIFSLLVDNPQLSQALGSETVSFQLGLVAFGILYSPISMIIGFFMNGISRKHEYEADAFAKKYGQAEGLISGLKKLTAKNLSNLTPHPLYVKFNFSHPTLYQRIKALKNA